MHLDTSHGFSAGSADEVEHRALADPKLRGDSFGGSALSVAGNDGRRVDVLGDTSSGTRETAGDDHDVNGAIRATGSDCYLRGRPSALDLLRRAREGGRIGGRPRLTVCPLRAPRLTPPDHAFPDRSSRPGRQGGE